MDGNGRMGRFWQTLILSQVDPVFKFLPMESIVREQQVNYYKKLRISGKKGDSAPFIEFMLGIILHSLEEFIDKAPKRMNTTLLRLELAKEKFRNLKFSRKEYMECVPEISTATASRDLKLWLKQGHLQKEGEKNQSKYFFNQ